MLVSLFFVGGIMELIKTILSLDKEILIEIRTLIDFILDGGI